MKIKKIKKNRKNQKNQKNKIIKKTKAFPHYKLSKDKALQKKAETLLVAIKAKKMLLSRVEETIYL